jgi:hypothetical protein
MNNEGEEKAEEEEEEENIYSVTADDSVSFSYICYLN